MRHNLTEQEIKRIYEAGSLVMAVKIAGDIEREREAAEKQGRCYLHNRRDCQRCNEALDKMTPHLAREGKGNGQA